MGKRSREETATALGIGKAKSKKVTEMRLRKVGEREIKDGVWN